MEYSDKSKNKMNVTSRRPQWLLILAVCIAMICSAVLWSLYLNYSLKAEIDAAKRLTVDLQQELGSLRAELQSLKIQSLMTDADKEVAKKGVSLTDLKNMDLLHWRDEKADVNKVTKSSASVKSGHAETVLEVTDAQSEYDKGQQALSGGHYQRAIEHFKNVDAASEEYLDARRSLANTYLFAGQIDNAITAFKQLLELEPGSVEASIGLANAHYRKGEHDKQITAYTNVIAQEPGQWLHYNSRGIAYYLNGEFDKATGDFIKAAELAAGSSIDQSIALENIGLVQLSKQNWRQAFNHTSFVNNINDKRPWNWLIRGVAALQLQQPNDAWNAFINWFKYRKPTDPFLIKQYLPASLSQFADVTPAGLANLIDAPAANGTPCVNNAQCGSNYCAPGAPDNNTSYCTASGRHCGAPQSEGHHYGEKLVINGVTVRCYQPVTGPGRWTLDLNQSSNAPSRVPVDTAPAGNPQRS